MNARRRIRATLLAAASTFVICASFPSAQSPSDDARRLAQQAQQRMRELQAEADRLAAQTSTLLVELRKLELEREIKVQAVRKADAELREVTTQLNATAARLKKLEQQRVADTPGVQERLTELYKRGRGGYVRMMMASDDLRAFGRLSRGVAAVAHLDRVRFEAHRRTIKAEQEALTELETRQTAVAKAQAEAVRARRALDVALAAHNRRLDELDQRRDLAAQYVGELQHAAAELQKRAAGLTSDAPATLPIAPFRGALDWPITGRVVARYGRSTDRFGTPISRNGIEIASEEGTPVRAVHGGLISFAAPFVGYGNLVIVDHGDNAFSLYGHLQELNVAEGAHVAKGTRVGTAGRNPAGQPVVYFELRIDGQPVDPAAWLRR